MRRCVGVGRKQGLFGRPDGWFWGVGVEAATVSGHVTYLDRFLGAVRRARPGPHSTI
jgi:hypothetical protein